METKIVAAVAVLLAGCAGFFLQREYVRWRRKTQPAKLARGDGWHRLSAALRDKGSFHELVMAGAMLLAQHVRIDPSHSVGARMVKRFDLRCENIALSGLEGSLSAEGLYELRARLAGVGCVCGALLGAPFSWMLAGLLAVVGLCVGWSLPGWALGQSIRLRAEDAQRHLPEMLDVLSLGLKSGLSFDAALEAYCEHFETSLSHDLREAKASWTCGLTLRDEALRGVCATYDSPTLSRVMGDIVRSLRHGSALAASLEMVAAEARKDYRASRQEEVAKAPVKMMIPTGTLILPAMLMLVLGPVMLELIEGF